MTKTGDGNGAAGSLSSHHWEAIRLLVRGLSPGEIARRMQVDERMVLRWLEEALRVFDTSAAGQP